MRCKKCVELEQKIPATLCEGCGTPVLEKCSECGELEPVERKVCAAKVRRKKEELGKQIKSAQEALNKYVFQKTIWGSVITGIIFSLVGFVEWYYFCCEVLYEGGYYGSCYDSLSPIFQTFLFLLSFPGIPVGLFIFWWLMVNKRKNKARTKFLQTHLAEAEILR